MLVPQGYDLKALEPIGHLGAVLQFKLLGSCSLTAPYMRDKGKLHFLVCFSQEMLDEPIGHLGAVFSNLNFSEVVVLRHLTCGINPKVFILSYSIKNENRSDFYNPTYFNSLKVSL
ncbi:MAG: hypothetical protein ACFWT6_08365 [Virgibacillus proomii]|jgi:hypothetical protein